MDIGFDGGCAKPAFSQALNALIRMKAHPDQGCVALQAQGFDSGDFHVNADLRKNF
ncbi:MAG: hypothetical protein AB3N15_00080 [Paracoccaceae bacterium]